MKVLDLLNEMDGAGLVITGDDEELEESLEILNLHIDTNLVPITYWERNSIKNCLMALKDIVAEMKEGKLTEDISYLSEWSDDALKIVDKWRIE